MKEYQKTFIELAIESKALQFGSFTLKSGRLSPYFFNAANLLNSGKLDLLGKCYFEAFSEEDIDIHSIFGPAYKGIFLGSILSLLLSKNNKAIPLSFNRKEIKDHGEGGNIIGDNPKGKTLIIDDVLSAGTAGKKITASNFANMLSTDIDSSSASADYTWSSGKKALVQRCVKITAATSAVIVEEVQVVGG